MHKYVSHIRAALPYEPPGTEARYLRIDLDLDRLTILVGPNASGKTAVLEAIGYIMSGLLEPTYCSLGLSLTTTLRPRKFMPSPIVGTVTLNSSSKVSTLYIKLTDLLSIHAEDKFLEMIYFALGAKADFLLREIEKDVSNNKDRILKLLEIKRLERLEKIRKAKLVRKKLSESIEILTVFDISFLRSLEEKRLITELISNITGQSIDKIEKEMIKHILLSYHLKGMKILYNINEFNSIDKAFVVEGIFDIVVFERKHEETVDYLRAAVFHPGFVYKRGVFERMYRAYIYEGLPNEKESIHILKKYIEFVDGYELVGKRLHIRTVNGRRIPVYSLSDGYRVAVFMGILYAISKPPVLFLIDTPEAFVHPDGLPVIADLIAHLVAEGNQVIVATQSMEFLEELLVRAKEHGIIDYTSVQRVMLTREGIVKVKGGWSGEVGLESIRELGADLRR